MLQNHALKQKIPPKIFNLKNPNHYIMCNNDIIVAPVIIVTWFGLKATHFYQERVQQQTERPWIDGSEVGGHQQRSTP